MSPFTLAGRRALITGSSRGIGAAIALMFAEHGADVAVCGRTLESLERIAADVRIHGREVVPIVADLMTENGPQRALDTAVEAFGTVDTIVNNVGGSAVVDSFLDMSAQDWHDVVHLNFTVAVGLLRAAGPHLIAGGRGVVINVASVAAFGGGLGQSAYAAAKAATVSLTRTLALEWADSGIRVNALCPGWTTTDLTRQLWEDPRARAHIARQIPLGRWGRPEEVAAAAVFLASEAAAFITGQTLVVDGGQLT